MLSNFFLLQPVIPLLAVPIQPPNSAPLDFHVEVNGPRMLTFSWKSPPNDQQNGPIVGYQVQCSSHHHGREMNMTVNEYTHLTDDRLSVTEFLPNTSYNCSVAALTSAGRGPFVYQTVSTLEDGML